MWEGSKFWKQFFEASANVSLTGYEEAAEDAEGEEGTYVEHITTAGSSALGSRTVTPVEGSEGVASDGEGVRDDVDESLLTSPSVAHATSTPRLPPASASSKSKGKTVRQPQFADYPSPYESLKREMQASSSPAQPPPEPTVALHTAATSRNPITPGRATSAIPDMSMTPSSSPFAIPPATSERQHAGPGGARANNDPLLHRMLDRNYRIAATPHTQRRQAQANGAGKDKAGGNAATPSATTKGFLDDDLGSSPDVPAPPQLRADLFSPAKVAKASARIPGVSVQTPSAKRQIRKSLEARGRTTAARGEDETATRQTTRDIFGQQQQGQQQTKRQGPAPLWDSDEDDDTNADGLGFSPPKTMQFHIPQSRVLQTPAREASRRIVEDLLLTAGGDITDDETGGGLGARSGVGEDSPSVIRQDGNLDDSF